MFFQISSGIYLNLDHVLQIHFLDTPGKCEIVTSAGRTGEIEVDLERQNALISALNSASKPQFVGFSATLDAKSDLKTPIRESFGAK